MIVTNPRNGCALPTVLPPSTRLRSRSLPPQLKLLSPDPPHPRLLPSFRTNLALTPPLCATAQDFVLEENPVPVPDVGVPPRDNLPAGLQRELMPRHVAVIMDGNRRWARKRGFPVTLGYEAGIGAFRLLVELCCRWGIKVLTVFAFSKDNWLRPKVEVDFLMALFEKGLKEEVDNFIREDIQISVIGDTSKVPQSLLKLIADAEEKTKNNSRLQLIIAVSYSGQYDIVQACRSIALKVQDGLIEPEDVNEFLFEQELETNCTDIPYPDLLIRTSGELRVSNFFLWQLAYTELFFTKSHWPEFGEADLLEALQSFQQRQRRFGRRQ